MRRQLRRALLTLTAAACLFLLAPASSHADDEPKEERNKECLCEDGAYGACQHFLRNPKGATEDPCWCHKCRTFSEHDGRTVPENMAATCFTSSRMGCYLKRHAVAWGITCSECVEDDDCCPNKGAANCPDCGEGGENHFSDANKQKVREHLAREQKFFKKPKKVIVAFNKNFYICTDPKPLKVKKKGGGSYRIASPHEWAHLMVERAEYARREFIDHFGSGLQVNSRLRMYLPAKPRAATRVQAEYLGSPKTNLRYGGGGGVFCEDLQKRGNDDHRIHMAVRHMIGHLLIASWVVTDPNSRALPPWLFVGVAHWLSRLQSRFRDDATFCGNETAALTDSGDDWERDCAKRAKSGKYAPIEELFGKSASGQLQLNDHKRSWSYMHLALREWRQEWVRVLADLRREKAPRDTFMQHLNCTPEIFHERWENRLLGRRKSLAPGLVEDDFEGNDTPGARERRKLKAQREPAKLAALVRGLGTVTDERTVRVVIDLLKINSELVRETIVITLLKVKDTEVQEAMWPYGLGHKNAMSRAYIARICGRQQLEYALPKLREQLEDKNWYARSEAAVAIGRMQDAESMSALRTMIKDPAEKARVAAMDALAMFGEEAHMAVPLIVKHLKSPQWQLRVTACQALGKIGSMEAVEDLISRMEVESGRVRGDLYGALKEITRDDLGRDPKFWREWWDREKSNAPGGMPKRPDEPTGDGKPGESGPDPDDRYARPEYYGIEIYSARLGYVIDTSGSMAQRFDPDSEAVRVLGNDEKGNPRNYAAKNSITICKEQIAYSLLSLDPRSHFNIIAFGTTIRSMNKNPIPASSANVNKAKGFLRSLPANGETNYYGALRAALDVGKTVDASPNFKSTPDTITFLTDGKPTRGEMTDADTLLEWYTALNRYARVRTHVIAFGNSIDPVLLRGMAERNDGKFIQVREKR